MRNILCLLIISATLLVVSCVPKDLSALLEDITGKESTSEATSDREKSNQASSRSSSSYSFGLNPFQKAQQEATAAQYERGDIPAAIREWESVLPKYQGKEWLFSEAAIYSSIGYLYSQAKEFGKAFGYAERSDKLLDEVEKIGVLTIDDDGMGGRASEKEARFRNVGNTRETIFNGLRSTNNVVRMTYYRAAGESDKADAIGREVSQEAASQTQDIYESTRKTAVQTLRMQAEYDKSLTEAEIQRRAHEQAQEVLDRHLAYKRAQEEMTILRAELMRRSRSGETDLDSLIDRYVELMIGQDPTGTSMYEANAKSYEEHGQPDVARDYRRLGVHHMENYTKPWGRAIKATLLLETDRPQEALATLEQAYARINSPTPLPRLETETGRNWSESMGGFRNKDLISWDFLKAQIYTRMNDPRAIRAWDAILTELNKPPADVSKLDPHEKAAAQTAAVMRQTILGDRYQELAATEVAALHEKIGRKGEGLAYIDQLLKKRESARASFSVEAHKRGYLAANKRLYERYLVLSSNDPARNLLGMERAKSRAMVDLMAGGIGNMDDPTLRMVAEQRQAAALDASRQASQRKTRQIVAGLDKGLETLKHQNPELHSLVSVDVVGASELAVLLGTDTVALSYYVADETLFINVIGQGVNKVIVMPIARAGIFGAVFGYRQKLLDPSAKPSFKKGEVTVDWTIDGGTQRIEVANNMPFPLEIRGISGLYRAYAMGGNYPYLPMGYSMQSPAKTRVGSIAPGKKAIIYEQEQFGGGWTYSNYVENYIETNLGTAFASGLVVTQEGKDDELTVYEERGFTYTPLRQSLYDVLIKPVEPYIAGKRLVIVPHSVLHFLPFETLKNGQGKYLVENHAVSYAPSLNALRLSRMKNRGKPTKLVAYSDPLGDLTFARQEVDTVSDLFAEAVVLSGQEVTKESVASTMSQGDVVHFACHGIFNPASPLDSALVMASAGEQGQSLSRLRMEDLNLLTVGDIMRLKANPSLVFLSACDTGRARVSGGDELIGLVRGFFVAGSPSLVTTLWPIDDESTAMLAVRFYENLLKRNMDKSAALQEAKLYLMQNGFKDPYYWAAFVLQGDWQ